MYDRYSEEDSGFGRSSEFQTSYSGSLKDEDFSNLDAVVVGASWAGIWTLHLLKEQGLRVILLDNNADVGGSWFYTRYPGCRVDTEVPLYQFSHPELWQEWEWTERLPSSDEIRSYLCWVCDRLNLRQYMRFNTRVTSSVWKEDTHQWMLTCDDGAEFITRYFVGCVGYTTIKNEPEYPGIENFKCRHHTSEWPGNLSCAGKRIGVIGTGASGLQVIEELGPVAGHLTVFQRTPNLATPARQKRFTEDESANLKFKYPEIFKSRLSRTSVPYTTNRDTDKDPVRRNAFYEEIWEQGALRPWLGNYRDLFVSPWANKQFYNFWREKVLEVVSDESVARILAPEEPPHAFGAKRPSLETNYFKTFNQPNVKLVDIQTDPILEVTADGIRTKSEDHDLDILVLATGFDFLTASTLRMGLKGVDGVHLAQKWDTRAEGNGVWTYLGLQTSSFPNFFSALGPQTPSAMGITPHIAEIQGKFISDCIGHMREHGLTRIEAKHEAEQEWKYRVVTASQNTLFGDANSWYMGSNIQGRKKQPLCDFGGIDQYAKRVQEEASKGYPGFRLSSVGDCLSAKL